ncbi:MAG: tol-pal system-associated acyl-CoA thioesterase [Marinobacterium sp.]
MPFQWPLRVYIEDTDLGGIVYYVNYLKFMERARTELLRQCGGSQQALMADDIIFVVTRTECRYLAPARLDDELLVEVSIERASRVRVSFQQRIVCQADNRLLCEADVDVACVRASDIKPTRWPDNLLQSMKTVTKSLPAVEEK